MMQNDPELVLASVSPRRLLLLEQLGIRARVVPADIDETVIVGESVSQYVLRLGCEKAKVVAHIMSELPVLAADTAITLKGEIFGKPSDLKEAAHMLEKLSGKTHEVLTGTAIVYEDQIQSNIVSTKVQFRELTEMEIKAYCQSGEPLGKAGAYAIQGLGASLISGITGSYSNVVGLPLCETTEMLNKIGINVLDPQRYKEIKRL